MQDWKMKDHGYFTGNIVSVLCMPHRILNDKLFSGALQMYVIAILFYCDFTCFQLHGWPRFHIMALW